MRESDRDDAVISTYVKSINYLATRFSLQKYRFRNYTADQQVYKGYLQSSLGSACISRYEVAYPEPDKQAFLNDKPYGDRSLQLLLSSPNQWMTETDFDRRTIKDQLLTGNSYWLKIYKGDPKRGIVKGLFPFNDMNITPVGTADNFIEYYKFITFDGEVTIYQPEDVVHLPWLYANPIYPNRGISPGALAARDIDTDTEFGQFIATFIANFGIPGGVIEVQKDAVIGSAGIRETTMKKIKGAFREYFAGKGRGDVLALEPGFTWKQTGVDLKGLDLQNARAMQEARTCALYLIPPEVVGVNVGMAHSTENNLAEARIRWVNSTLIPIWVQNAKKLSAGLQREYPGVEIKYDIDSVAAVKEQKINQVEPMSRALVQLFTGISNGSIPNESGRAILEGLFQYDQDMVDRMLPSEQPVKEPKGKKSITAEGAIV